MVKLRVFFLFLGFSAFFSSGAFAYVSDDEVSRALDLYESGDIVVSRPPGMDPERTVPAYSETAETQPVETVSDDPMSMRKPHETEMGLETYSYLYEETVDGGHFMDLQGRFLGIFLNHTFRPNQLDPFFSEFINMFRLELRYARGTLDYTGGVQFGNGDTAPLTMSGVPDWVLEGRVITGFDMPFHGMLLTPFTGIGMRALNDDSSKVSGTFDNNGTPQSISGYRRVSHYYYIPLGIELEKHFVGGWRSRLSMEYDYLVAGMQRSYSAVDITYEGVDYHYDSIKNNQPKGYGLRMSLNIKKDIGKHVYFVEPFYRFWDIDDSEMAHLDASDGYEFVGIAMEPANITREIGVKMGVVF